MNQAGNFFPRQTSLLKQAVKIEGVQRQRAGNPCKNWLEDKKLRKKNCAKLVQYNIYIRFEKNHIARSINPISGCY